MQRLVGKRILLGVTGSVAAYKAAELVRRLRDVGADVRVVMTRAATEFVAPLTFQALSGKPVHQYLLDPAAEAAMGHIDLARWADAILVAPASADFIARLAQGRADDLLTTLCLASESGVPLALAPAMNQQMWQDAATQDNVQLLRKRGVLMFGPGEGAQACGEIGAGRLVEPEQLLHMLAELFETGSLTGRTVMVTAGPTHEAIDPVRYIGNRSSGKMGFALAQAAIEAGARVILVSGPVTLATPARAERVDVESAEQMFQAVRTRIPGVDIFIAAAAVADYRPQRVAAQKLKKDSASFSLELERTPDILASVAQRAHRPFCVGFAAETEDLLGNAAAKLEAKGVDMIAANWVGPSAVDTQGTFGSDVTALRLFWPEGGLELPLSSKDKIARQLIAIIAERIQRRPLRPQTNTNKVVTLKQ